VVDSDNRGQTGTSGRHHKPQTMGGALLVPSLDAERYVPGQPLQLPLDRTCYHDGEYTVNNLGNYSTLEISSNRIRAYAKWR
jgi:hypothetical protein